MLEREYGGEGKGDKGKPGQGQGICPLSIWDGDIDMRFEHGRTIFIQDKDKT